MNHVFRVSARLSRLSLFLAGSCLALLGAIVDYGVIMRYIFNNAPDYVGQVALLLVISVAMFGAAAGVHDAGHIGLDSAVKMLPPKARFGCHVAAYALTAVFSVVLLGGSIEMAMTTLHHTIPTLGISEASRYLPPIVAGALMILFSVEHLLILFTRTPTAP